MKSDKIHIKQIENTIIEMEINFLKDTVNNVFSEIDSMRERKKINYKKNIEARQRRFIEEVAGSEEEFIKFYIERFADDANISMWTAVLWNDDSKELLYTTPNIKSSNIDNITTKLDLNLSVKMEINKGNVKGVFGVEKSYINNIIKQEIGDLLRIRRFANNSYLWVNEIIDYKGGDNYAIRRVHPNLIETEGAFLSTDMEDVKGNLPYLEELEGINKDGEVILEYYFKELDNPEISKKMTYAKLYKDYDWVICMGVHLDTIEGYADKINKETSLLVRGTILSVLKYIIGALFIGFGIITFMDRRRTNNLEREINIDTLTKTYSRRYGEEKLKEVFNNYKKTMENAAIMMLDIDKFKNINDKYGHDIGDLILAETCSKVKEIVRDTDMIIRWGGDEFLGIFTGIKRENIDKLGTNLINNVLDLNFKANHELVKVSISIGFSYFLEEDNNYKDAIIRADKAMYSSKNNSHSKIHILP